MLRIITAKLLKQFQNGFLDEIRDVDWGDEEPPYRGSIDENNYEDYLVDEIEEPTRTELSPEQPGYRPEFLDEIPTSNEILGIPEGTREVIYDSPFDLISDSLGYAPISFEYTNRHGMYVGRRTVEPHDWFVASSTGNNIVVTYDLDVQDIRAFIIGNIHPGGVRYEGVPIPDRSFRDI
jgi:hypothetical protein